MKIIHTADWHLGNNFHGHDRVEEHQHFFNWLLAQLRERMPDALIVAGDVFDSSNPPAIAEEMFYNFLTAATEAVRGLQIVVTAGNHDSAGRLDAPARLLKRHNVYMRGVVQRSEENGEVDFDHLILPLGNRLTNEAEIVCVALPYLRPSDYPSGMTVSEGLSHFFEKILQRVRKSDFKKLPIVATAHFYAAGAEVCANEHSERLVVGGQDCVEASVVGKGVCYTALGHIHKAQRVDCSTSEVHYSGSVLPMSFSEKGYQHGVNYLEIDENGKTHVERIPYAPLRRLLSIPEKGSIAASEVLRLISQLPQRQKGDLGSQWPYLEIRVEERQPEPTLMHEVSNLLTQKAVRFCRMVRERPVVKTTPQVIQSIDNIRSVSPVEMAQRLFESRFHESMPAELTARLREAEEKVCQTDL